MVEKTGPSQLSTLKNVPSQERSAWEIPEIVLNQRATQASYSQTDINTNKKPYREIDIASRIHSPWNTS